MPLGGRSVFLNNYEKFFFLFYILNKLRIDLFRSMAMLAHIPGNVLDGNFRAVAYLDNKASQQQIEALLAAFGGNRHYHSKSTLRAHIKPPLTQPLPQWSPGPPETQTYKEIYINLPDRQKIYIKVYILYSKYI